MVVSVSYDDFLERFNQAVQTGQTNQFYTAVCSNDHLRQLFERVMTDDTFVSQHQDWMVDGINAIYPAQEGFRKVEQLSQQFGNSSITKVFQKLFYTSNPTEEVIDAINQGHFLRMISLFHEHSAFDLHKIKASIVDPEKERLFYIALKNAPLDIKRSFLAPDSYGETPPLLVASIKNDTGKFESVLAICGEDKSLKEQLFNTSFSILTTPLYWAISNNNPQMVSDLISFCGEDIDLLRLLFAHQDMHNAVAQNKVEIVRLLVTACRNKPELIALVFTPDVLNRNPLDYAANNNIANDL